MAPATMPGPASSRRSRSGWRRRSAPRWRSSAWRWAVRSVRALGGAARRLRHGQRRHRAHRRDIAGRASDRDGPVRVPRARARRDRDRGPGARRPRAGRGDAAVARRVGLRARRWSLVAGCGFGARLLTLGWRFAGMRWAIPERRSRTDHDESSATESAIRPSIASSVSKSAVSAWRYSIPRPASREASASTKRSSSWRPATRRSSVIA